MKLFVRDLTVIDASYLCPERGMVGDSWILDVVMSGELNEMSMVLDFGRVKKQIKKLVDEYVDHRLLVPVNHPSVQIAETTPGYATVDLLRGDQSIHLHCPEEAYCLVEAEAITIDTVTEHLYQVLAGELPENVQGLELVLRHEKIDGAFYHYSHGLKKHDGNCQRIAHGHRSPIELYVDGQRDSQLEADWAKRWTDIYLGTVEDQVSVTALNLSEHAKDVTDETHYGFRYTAPQGLFELAITKRETEMIHTDTTIELLAHFIAAEVKPMVGDNQHLEVVAYEGVGKGAMASL
ncbi:6-carboxytetrahydropterin synthase [Photobacterium galatheae]|uniref:6-carboxy-5,6,7,8-tetrahydropterin synthase n=1 Tax=Photobacterium galatheae TaxID=1654360 RepID=A0A066RKY6_9GAMM|nr:6-carboxytetrahydropterin synthase [Photobacterium galatheae]KDM89756.1 6-pyruvoyl tetrahydropterin synthase [Photobacterium galatheae]MCM0151408.1 6-carboxytetrahydropterin synthase [Photobacterium galatheae]